MKRKPGRPAKDRSWRVDLRLPSDSGRAVDAAAAAAGLTVTEWLARAAAYCVAVRVPLVSRQPQDG